MEYFNSIIKEIQNFRDVKIPRYVSKITKIIKELEFLERIVQDNPIEIKKIPRDWEIIAIDGGCDSTKLEGIAFAIATAQSFSLGENITNSFNDQRDIAFLDIAPKGDLGLISSIFMKAIETQVACKAIQKSKSEKIMVFFDGSFSFPDTSVAETEIEDLKKAFNLYKENLQEFFELIQKSNKIIVPVAIAKDARAGKYLTNIPLNNTSSPNQRLNDIELKKLKEIIKNQGWTERLIFQSILRKRNIDNKSSQFLPLIRIYGNNSAMHGDYAIDLLKLNGILGSYYYFPNAKKAFYFEIGKNYSNYIDEIISIFNFTCRVSPVIGYPFPLVYVDKLTRLSKDLSGKLFSQIIIEFKRLAPKLSFDFISEKLREDLH